MSLFRKNEQKKNNVDKKEKMAYTKGEIIVKIHNNNWTLFSNSTSYFLCINNDYSNIIECNKYYEVGNHDLLLEKDNMYAFLYWDSTTKDYIITDFIYNEFEIKDENLLRLKSGNIHSMYYKGFLFENAIGLIEYEKSNLFIVTYDTHQELYIDKYFIYSSKNIYVEFAHKLTDHDFYKSSFIKYQRDDNTYGCIFVDPNYYLSISTLIENKIEEFYFNSLNVCTLSKNNHYVIASDTSDKYFLFPISNIKKVSKKYDKIDFVNNLFLCIDGKHVEVIDPNYNVLYTQEFTDTSNIHLEYNNSQSAYTLMNKNNSIVSISLYYSTTYHKYYFYFCSIYDFNNRSSLFLDINTGFTKNNFVKQIKENVFEFKDHYVFIGADYCYYTTNKNIQINKTYFRDVITSEYMTDLDIEYKNKLYKIDKKYILLLKKLNACSCSIKSIHDDKISLEVRNYFTTFEICGNNISFKITEGLSFDLKIDDIKTNIVDYILENVTDKYMLALAKYYITEDD